MVLPAIPVAVWGLLRLIAWISGIVLVSANVRDIVTKQPGENISISRDATVEEILNSDLPDDQKSKLITEYLGVSGINLGGLEKYIPAAILGFVALSFLRK